MKNALNWVVRYNIKETPDSFYSRSWLEVEKCRTESKVYRQAGKKMFFFFFDKNLAGKILHPRFPTNTFFLLFAYCFAYFCLRKTENPEENKVAANQNITCYSKMIFSLFLLTYLASTTFFEFWKAEKQMLLPYTLLLLWHFLLQQ